MSRRTEELLSLVATELLPRRMESDINDYGSPVEYIYNVVGEDHGALGPDMTPEQTRDFHMYTSRRKGHGRAKSTAPIFRYRTASTSSHTSRTSSPAAKVPFRKADREVPRLEQAEDLRRDLATLERDRLAGVHTRGHLASRGASPSSR